MMCSIAETEIPSSLHTDNYHHFGCKINRSSRAPSSLNTDNQISSYYLSQQQQSVGSGGERLVERQGGGCVLSGPEGGIPRAEITGFLSSSDMDCLCVFSPIVLVTEEFAFLHQRVPLCWNSVEILCIA